MVSYFKLVFWCRNNFLVGDYKIDFTEGGDEALFRRVPRFLGLGSIWRVSYLNFREASWWVNRVDNFRLHPVSLEPFTDERVVWVFADPLTLTEDVPEVVGKRASMEIDALRAHAEGVDAKMSFVERASAGMIDSSTSADELRRQMDIAKSIQFFAGGGKKDDKKKRDV